MTICDELREALLRLADGERQGLDVEGIEAHRRSCERCSREWEAILAMKRRWEQWADTALLSRPTDREAILNEAFPRGSAARRAPTRRAVWLHRSFRVAAVAAGIVLGILTLTPPRSARLPRGWSGVVQAVTAEELAALRRGESPPVQQDFEIAAPHAGRSLTEGEER